MRKINPEKGIYNSTTTRSRLTISFGISSQRVAE